MLHMSEFWDIFLRAGIAIIAIITLTRLHGLRSFSKMSGFDFAITVSIGSVLAGAVTTLGTPLWTFIAAFVALFIVQIVLSQCRTRFAVIRKISDNAPLLMMENGKMIPDNMRRAGMSENDLWAKLREANAYNLDHVHAVIMETTGDVSVLHDASQGCEISTEVLSDVARGTAQTKRRS